MKAARSILLPFMLVLILALFSLYGCTETSTEGESGTTHGALQDGLSQQELQEILADSLTNYEDLNTYKFDMDMDILADASGGIESGKMIIITKTSGATNIASQQMQMLMDMSMTVEDFQGQSGSQSMVYDMYMLPDWTYMRLEMPGMAEQWVKTPTTDELMESFDTDVIDQQLEPLESPFEIILSGYENIDGMECYVLSISPDMGEFMQWVSDQQGTSESVDWEELGMASDAFKEFTYVCYVAKDTHLLKKLVLDMVMEFTPEQAGASPEDFDTMIMEIRLDMHIYDYNQPFSVILPDEAENAIEMPASAFS